MINWTDYLTADFESGTLTWRERVDGFGAQQNRKAWNTRYAGKIAGTVDKDGYMVVNRCGKLHRAHRILFEMAHGPIPDGLEIDHIDGNRRNNSLSNLRLATRSQNSSNSVKRSDNASGFKGVCLHKPSGKWVAYITIAGKRKHIGIYRCPTVASLAYISAAKLHFGEFARFK